MFTRFDIAARDVVPSRFMDNSDRFHIWARCVRIFVHRVQGTVGAVKLSEGAVRPVGRIAVLTVTSCCATTNNTNNNL